MKKDMKTVEEIVNKVEVIARAIYSTNGNQYEKEFYLAQFIEAFELQGLGYTRNFEKSVDGVTDKTDLMVEGVLPLRVVDVFDETPLSTVTEIYDEAFENGCMVSFRASNLFFVQPEKGLKC